MTPAEQPSTWQLALGWWRALPSRDRSLATFAITALVLASTWLLAVQPAWRTLARAPVELDVLDAQLQSMQRQAAEATDLRATPPVNAEQAAAALKAATERLGDHGRLLQQGERAVLTLTAAGPEQLRAWLAEARSGARARPVEVNLTRGTQGFSGTLVVAMGATL